MIWTDFLYLCGASVLHLIGSIGRGGAEMSATLFCFVPISAGVLLAMRHSDVAHHRGRLKAQQLRLYLAQIWRNSIVFFSFRFVVFFCSILFLSFCLVACPWNYPRQTITSNETT